MKSRISFKGQVTVPAEVRDRLGLWPGTVVTFEVCGGGALLKKGCPGEHPSARTRSCKRTRCSRSTAGALFRRLKIIEPQDVG